MPHRTFAVIVRYNPPKGFSQRVLAALEQCDGAIVVDNASEAAWQLKTHDIEAGSRISIVRNQDNVGIAEALNQGIALAAEKGATYAFLLDHDSVPEGGSVVALREAIEHEPPGSIAAAVPRIRYSHPDIACRWPQTNARRGLRFRFVHAATMTGPEAVDLAISSGMLVPIVAWRALNGFDSSLFIDLVDTDYCLRARRSGRNILAVPSAVIRHALGDVVQRKLLGVLAVYPTHHNAIRHYYIGRNRILLAKRHARACPSWLIYELLGGGKLVVKVLLFEPDRVRKLTHMLRGSLHGLLGWRGRAHGL